MPSLKATTSASGSIAAIMPAATSLGGMHRVPQAIPTASGTTACVKIVGMSAPDAASDAYREHRERHGEPQRPQIREAHDQIEPEACALHQRISDACEEARTLASHRHFQVRPFRAAQLRRLMQRKPDSREGNAVFQ